MASESPPCHHARLRHSPWRSAIRPLEPGRLPRHLAPLAVASIGLVHAASYAYVTSDDAFISLRYAVHLAEGTGLVYNPGQPPVEGFSNPLLTVTAAGLVVLGAPPLLALKALGLAGLALALLLLPRLVHTLEPSAGRLSALAAPALLAASAYPAFGAMTGLETTLHSGLVVAAVLASVAEVARGRVGLGPLAWLAVACSRPEGAWLAAAAAAAQWGALGLDRRVVARWTVGFALPALGLLAARYAYYGALLPNTFHAKVGLEGMGKEGGPAYLADLVLGAGAWVALPGLLGLGLAAVRGESRRMAVPGAVVAAQAAFVLLVGGDFMPGMRFAMPVYPLLCAGAALLLARALRPLPRRPAIAVRALALALLCAGAALFQSLELRSHPLRFWLLHEGPWTAYLDRTTLRGTWLAGHEATGHYLRQYAEPGDRLVVSEAGVIPFYAELNTLDLYGLTDRELASLWNEARGGGVAKLREGMERKVFAAEPRWIVLDGHRTRDGRFYPRLQIARWLLAHPDARRYRPVFRAPVYTTGSMDISHDRINVVFERRHAAPAGGADPTP